MAMPFLEAGLHVFVDKPLSLDIEELRQFRPYLESGHLMSGSGLYYAKELDEVRSSIETYGRLKLIRGSGGERVGKIRRAYALCCFELSQVQAGFGCRSWRHPIFQPPSAWMTAACSRSTLSEIVRRPSASTSGATRDRSSHEIVDNFSMFRRMLWHFGQSIKNAKPAMNPETTLDIMRILMAGRMAQKEKRKVLLDEIAAIKACSI